MSILAWRRRRICPSVELTRASGTLDGEGLQVHWLRPVPPIDNGQAQLRIVDPDTLEIIVTGGRQRLRNQKEASAGGLQIRGGRMRITGLMQPHQIGVIEADIAGPLPDALALLREPRLALARSPSDRPEEPGRPGDGETQPHRCRWRTRCGWTTSPSRCRRISTACISARLVAGRDLDQGVLDLTANTDGMKLNGRALLASIPAKLDAAMDFRAGPPTQVVQSVTVSGQPDARQLAAAGLDATSVLNGPAQLQAVLSERRNGQGDVAVTADLTGAELAVAPLEWRKPRDAPAKASARLLLDHDRLTGIDAVQLDGDGVVLRGRADFSGGRLSRFRVDRLVLGRTVAQGTVNLPTGGPDRCQSQRRDARSGAASRPPHPAAPRQPRDRTEPPPGPPWVVDAKFDRVLMAQGRASSDVMAARRE